MAEDSPPEEARGGFPFTKLPAEIQRDICLSLCGHCGRENDPVAVFYHDPAEQTQALLSLCLASREMRSLTQDILYHYPRVYSYTSFFRTLKARPELADSVRVLKEVYQDELWRHHTEEGNYASSNDSDRGDNNDNDHTSGSKSDEKDSSVPSREDIWYLHSLAVQLNLDNTDLDEFQEAFRLYPSRHQEDYTGNVTGEICRKFDNLVTAITVALCTRLEFLVVNMEDKEIWGSGELWPTKYLYLPGLVKHRPKSLQNVHTLVLRNTTHLNPNLLGLHRASTLWALLPNVTRLVLFKANHSYESGVDDLLEDYDPKSEPQPEYLWTALSGLKELRLVRYSRWNLDLPLPAIERLLSRCPKLEKFTICPTHVGDKAFQPSRLLSAISPAATTLRHLTINCPIQEASHVWHKYILGSDLKQFTSLESLVLDQAVFCHHHHDPANAVGDGCLTDILPNSLQRLTVNIHGWLSPVIDLIALGCAVSKGEFQKLQHLRVQMTFEDEYWPQSDPPPTPSPDSPDSPRFGPLEGRPDEVNLPLLEPRKRRQRQILDSFKGTNVRVEIDFFRRRLNMAAADTHPSPPFGGAFADARLIDEAE